MLNILCWCANTLFRRRYHISQGLSWWHMQRCCECDLHPEKVISRVRERTWVCLIIMFLREEMMHWGSFQSCRSLDDIAGWLPNVIVIGDIKVGASNVTIRTITERALKPQCGNVCKYAGIGFPIGIHSFRHSQCMIVPQGWNNFDFQLYHLLKFRFQRN